VAVLNCSDPDGDTLHYDVYLGTDQNALTCVKSGATLTQYDPELTAGTTYYWKVTATDGVHSVTGGPWRFATATASTTPPTVTITSPADGATVAQTVTVVAEITDADGVDRSSIAVTVSGQAADTLDTVPIANGYRVTATKNGVSIGADVPIVVTAADLAATRGATPSTSSLTIGYHHTPHRRTAPSRIRQSPRLPHLRAGDPRHRQDVRE
jgi:hypothetical protein